MQSRMDKYNTNVSQARSRTQKNQELYENVRNSSLTDFNVNSNMSVIGDSANKISVDKVRRILDERYNDSAPKRRSIEIPKIEEPIIEDSLIDTKEYDINAILQKAKQGKNVDYNKERLKKVREAQYEILNNLDLELKKVEDNRNNEKNKEAEDNLMNLINTITELELRNKTNALSNTTAHALDLLSDLKDDDDEKNSTESIQVENDESKSKDEKIETSENTEPSKSEEELKEERIEKTLSKLEIDISSYDEFSDISKRDSSSIILKILIFIIIIALVIGAVYILDKLLELGLF